MTMNKQGWQALRGSLFGQYKVKQDETTQGLKRALNGHPAFWIKKDFDRSRLGKALSVLTEDGKASRKKSLKAFFVRERISVPLHRLP